jgi:hypothetical protein
VLTARLRSATHAEGADIRARDFGHQQDPNQLDYACHLRNSGHTIAQIVAKTGITRSSLYRHLPPRPPGSVTVDGLPLLDRSIKRVPYTQLPTMRAD